MSSESPQSCNASANAAGAFANSGPITNSTIYVAAPSSAQQIPEVISRLCYLPFSALGAQFVGRDHLLGQLEIDLIAQKSAVLRSASAVFSDGGVGKTTLAV